jgi:citrate synthase
VTAPPNCRFSPAPRRTQRRLLDLHEADRHTSLDYGFVNTAATKSAITFIDGDQGILRYRGYPIEQLAKNSTYLEVAWLLLYGELPTADELGEWDDKIRHHTLLHEDLKRFFSSLPHTAHPMSVLSAATAALSTYYEGQSDPNNPEHVELNTIRLLAKLPVIAAYATRRASVRRSSTRTTR